ncbi:hypothetical protein Tco_1218903 [Tanacetum coccineum]
MAVIQLSSCFFLAIDGVSGLHVSSSGFLQAFNHFPRFLQFPDLLGYQIDLFVFICHSDPSKVRIREREPTEREVKLLTLTKGRTVLFNPPDSAASRDSDDSIDKLFDDGVMLDDNSNFLCFDCNLDCTGFDYFAHMVEQNPVVEFG